MSNYKKLLILHSIGPEDTTGVGHWLKVELNNTKKFESDMQTIANPEELKKALDELTGNPKKYDAVVLTGHAELGLQCEKQALNSGTSPLPDLRTLIGQIQGSVTKVMVYDDLHSLRPSEILSLRSMDNVIAMDTLENLLPAAVRAISDLVREKRPAASRPRA